MRSDSELLASAHCKPLLLLTVAGEACNIKTACCQPAELSLNGWSWCLVCSVAQRVDLSLWMDELRLTVTRATNELS